MTLGCTSVHTPEVRYEWDPAKLRANLAKHGVGFADAALVLEDTLALTRQDPDAKGEERFITLGVDPTGRLLVVVWTLRGENVPSSQPGVLRLRNAGSTRNIDAKAV